MTENSESGRDAAISSYQATSQDVEEAANDLSFRAVDPVNVHVKDLNVDIDVSPSGLSAFNATLRRKKSTREPEVKAILKGVNAYMPGGSLTAIIGSSGSGKTSVLNALSNRVAGGRLKTTGDITYNGGSQISSIRSAYVMQQDVLLPTLTVRETLRYAAELRLPPPTTKEEREEVVQNVILELGLKECECTFRSYLPSSVLVRSLSFEATTLIPNSVGADTRIGNNVHKGCSGGEKRRTSLAVQMLSNPSVLFCDEVTTGLDAATAFQLIATLKALADRGRTIICSIHQPRSEIWQLFERVVLLAKGSPLYSGPSVECLQYFERLGYVLPPFVNPAEFLIDLAAVDTRSPDAEDASLSRVQGLIQTFETSPENKGLSAVQEKTSVAPSGLVAEKSRQHHATLGHQIKTLTERTFKVTFRDPLGIAGSMLEAISMAIITGWIFLQLDGSLSGIRSREGALYTAASLRKALSHFFLPVQDCLFEYGTCCTSSPILSPPLLSKDFCHANFLFTDINADSITW